VAKETARFGGVLIVEDSPGLAESLGSAFSSCSERVIVAPTAALARAALESAEPLELVVTDIRLPDGSGADIARLALARQPMPLVLAMSGEATAEESFELARVGVHAYVAKPLTMETLLAALENALQARPPVLSHVRAAVGKVPLHELEAEVRDAMLDEAMARADGSRRGAARLLSVSRQLMQHMLRAR